MLVLYMVRMEDSSPRTAIRHCVTSSVDGRTQNNVCVYLIVIFCTDQWATGNSSGDSFQEYGRVFVFNVRHSVDSFGDSGRDGRGILMLKHPQLVVVLGGLLLRHGDLGTGKEH